MVPRIFSIEGKQFSMMSRRMFLVFATAASAATKDVASAAGDDGGIVGSSGDGDMSASQDGVIPFTGEVMTYDGMPLEGVTLTFESRDTPPVAIPEIAVMTNAQGQFSFQLPAGHYAITLTSREGSQKRRLMTLTAQRHLRLWLPR